RELRVVLHQGMLGTSAAHGILAILRAAPEVRERDNGAGRVGALTPSVAFEEVTFAYPGGRGAAHERLSFSVPPGERSALGGPRGSGEYTVARRLLGFCDRRRG